MHLWAYLVQFFLEWEMFQTKVYRKSKHILCAITLFSENHAVLELMWKNTVEPDRQQMTIRRMRIACCIPNATYTHSEYVILIAFPQQKRLHERASILRCTYIFCLLINYCLWLSMEVMSLFLTCNEHSTIFCTGRGNFCFCQHSYELAGNASINCRSVTALRPVLSGTVACWLVACGSVRDQRERVCLLTVYGNSRGPLIFKKSRRHLKILDAGEVTLSKFRSEDPQYSIDLWPWLISVLVYRYTFLYVRHKLQ